MNARFSHDLILLQRTENLILKTQNLYVSASNPKRREALEYALKFLSTFGDSILHNRTVFGLEPWHPLPPSSLENPHKLIPAPAEMLLRLQSARGKPLPPYPAVMAFYDHGLATDLDIILVLRALHEFQIKSLPQVSINISAHSLNNPDFIKIILPRIESMGLTKGERVIFEVHESTANLRMNTVALNLFLKFGVNFALDDIGLDINHVLRMSNFENYTRFIKLDRSIIESKSLTTLRHTLDLIAADFPDARIVAEGVKSAEQAFHLRAAHPSITHVQGRYLPPPGTFAHNWNLLWREQVALYGEDLSKGTRQAQA
jgi:EAL domain-containing protein (putative c-di-GMP-specific phosphodiesterase class I)